MSVYAQGTAVPVERSKAEIERTLARYGAERFVYGTEPGAAVIMFEVSGRRVRMRLKLPDAEPFRKTPRGKARSEDAARREWDQACRQSWRSLCLVVKAKLEAITSVMLEKARLRR